MATKRNEMPRWSDEQLAEMMSLINGSDSVELKLTVPTDEHRATIARPAHRPGGGRSHARPSSSTRRT